MLFYTFANQEQRREAGGSDFIEIQFCKNMKENSVKKLVSVDSIQNWKDDSLYVKDENLFYTEYSHIFNCGIYNDLESGTVDIYGINYYSPAVTDSILKKLYETKPMEYEKLAIWLEKTKSYNGFYILGL